MLPLSIPKWGELEGHLPFSSLKLPASSPLLKAMATTAVIIRKLAGSLSTQALNGVQSQAGGFNEDGR